MDFNFYCLEVETAIEAIQKKRPVVSNEFLELKELNNFKDLYIQNARLTIKAWRLLDCSRNEAYQAGQNPVTDDLIVFNLVP